MDSHDIALLRLQNQNVSVRHRQTPLEVVEHMAAMQAQDYYNALWALGVRTGQTEQQIVDTLAARQVIRTWPQRGTIHFVAAENARWQVDLSATRLVKSAATRHKNLGLNEDIFIQSQKILSQALARNNYLTRPQVFAALEAGGIAASGSRGYHILWYLSQTGLTYIGPMEHKQQTFGLLSELKPTPEPRSREDSIRELAKCYFTSHGPATLQDFMWWAGLTAVDAKAGLAANENLLTSMTNNGKVYWFAKGSDLTIDTEEAFLLPGFDEFLLGYKDRSDMLSSEHTNKVVPGGNGMFFPMIVLRGQIVGTWKRIIKKDHVLLNFSPFEHLTSSDQALLEKPAHDYSAFLGLSPEIEII